MQKICVFVRTKYENVRTFIANVQNMRYYAHARDIKTICSKYIIIYY